MAGERGEAATSADKKPGWTIIEKVATAALVAFVLTLLGIVFGYSDRMRTLGSKVVAVEGRLNEKRPSGRSWSQQMQYNTDRVDALEKRATNCAMDLVLLENDVKKNHETFHSHVQDAGKEFSRINERCATVAARVNNGR